MKKFRLLSAFLSVVMAAGMSVAVIPLSASSATTGDPVPGFDYVDMKPSIDYLGSDGTTKFADPEAKLRTMTKVLPKDDEITDHGMELYIEPISGEIAYVNTKTGQILLSNPYDVGSQSKLTEEVKSKFLSQIIIDYSENGKSQQILSFSEACMRGQITVKEVKNGVRVEYAIGREENRKLVPKHIEKSRFESEILSKITDVNSQRRLNAWYTPQFPEDAKAESERKYIDMTATYPITKKMAIYAFDEGANERELEEIETIIKKYCPSYDFEQLEYDHALTEYEGADKAPVLFRLSLEYTLDEYGNLDVRLPANGIRFDESVYQLNSISVLPWFGAGDNSYSGYTMIPDGSGTLVRFEDVGAEPVTITAKVYGADYAYQEITGENKEVIRVPVYGVYKSDEAAPPRMVAGDGGAGTQINTNTKDPLERAFVAIIEEGESLATITTELGGSHNPYCTAYASFAPRPTDSYALSAAIAGSADAKQSVVSDRKYAGSFRIKYIMLTGENEQNRHGDKHYEASYVGMAKAYRTYLINEGILTEKTEVNENIPLYIESFGSIQTIEKVLSMPVEVLKPLTTFDDLKSMYEQLAAEGITNVNYKLTGFTNGGLNSTAPYHVEFDSEIGGDDGFTEFVNEYATEKGIGVYPDFDFANVTMFDSFDGISNKKHMIKTMDGRYTTKRYYDSTLQSFQRGFSLAVSPSVYEYLFDSFVEEYSALNPSGVAVSTLGTDLNSDFDKKEPYNREDSKEFTSELLANMEAYFGNVMIDGGNAYTLGYADHILNVPLDSSRYSNADEAIPFVGMVLHGCVDFAGTPINMAGDTMYELLKAIENGSSLYFTLSMQNTALLKEDAQFNKYYSVNFEIWFKDDVTATDVENAAPATDAAAEEKNTYDTVVELYNVLNNELKDLQNKQIIGHEFINGYRAGLMTEEEIAASEAQIEYNKENGVYNNDVFNPYLSDDGRVVKVTYEGGKTFLLNYNNFAVDVICDDVLYTLDPVNYTVIAAK